MTQNDPIQPYKASPDSADQLPDTQQLPFMQEVLPKHHRRPLVLGIVAAAVLTGGAAYGYSRVVAHERSNVPTERTYMDRGGLASTTEDVCYSPEVTRTIAGDPTAHGSDPEDWTNGVLLTVKPSAEAGYLGARIGFRGPKDSLEATEWSAPLSAQDLTEAPELMRTGPGTYTITVEGIAGLGSAACADKADVTYRQTTVAAALQGGAIEPEF